MILLDTDSILSVKKMVNSQPYIVLSWLGVLEKQIQYEVHIQMLISRENLALLLWTLIK